MRVCGSDLKTKRELPVSVESLENRNCNFFCVASWSQFYLVRVYYELETKEIVRVRELRLAGLGQLQLIDVLQVIIFYLM